MAKDYTKLLKSIENIVLVSVNPSTGSADPTPVSMFPMVHSGFLRDDETKINAAMNEFREAGGSLVQLGFDLTAVTKGMESDPAEFAVAEKFEKATCDIFYFGSSQSHRLKNVTPTLSIETNLAAKSSPEKIGFGITGKKFAPSLSETLELNNSAAFYSANPTYKYNAFVNTIRQANLGLAANPRFGHFNLQQNLYDASANRYVGTLTDYAAMWQSATNPEWFLRFDGVNDQVDFGSILNDDGVGDFLIEVWLRIQGLNGALEEILAKKILSTDTSAGFAIFRATTNVLQFRMANGTSSVVVGTASSVLQNVWKHFAVAVDRDGNAAPYLNDAADGTPASVAALSTASNALSLYLGRDGTNFGQVDIGAVRVYRFGAGGLPSNIAAIIAAHFNTEKAEYGL